MPVPSSKYQAQTRARENQAMSNQTDYLFVNLAMKTDIFS
jgi:hypothetical protein